MIVAGSVKSIFVAFIIDRYGHVDKKAFHSEDKLFQYIQCKKSKDNLKHEKVVITEGDGKVATYSLGEWRDGYLLGKLDELESLHEQIREENLRKHKEGTTVTTYPGAPSSDGPVYVRIDKD